MEKKRILGGALVILILIVLARATSGVTDSERFTSRRNGKIPASAVCQPSPTPKEDDPQG